MKKTYFAPETETIQAETISQLLSGSIIIDPLSDPIDAADAAAPQLELEAYLLYQE